MQLSAVAGLAGDTMNRIAATGILRIGCAAGATNSQVMRKAGSAGRFAPQAIVLTDTHTEGIQLLNE